MPSTNLSINGGLRKILFTSWGKIRQNWLPAPNFQLTRLFYHGICEFFVVNCSLRVEFVENDPVIRYP